MGFYTSLDEIDIEDLEDELRRRRELHDAGKCSYCENGHHSHPACRFPSRHRGLEFGRMQPGFGCSCGVNRREYLSPGDETFLPMTGCLNCGKWDGPRTCR
jgi:hypothetical protein